ncbi:hypothetical protein DL96DRAFT_1602742 [Flagelloscypha sp. PMI_526]|nr:hypothetical protein DL96DRAFT_1602742 [Flagelloscypha sp. PMI_526]
MPQGSDATQTTPLPIPQQSSSVVSNSSTTSSTHRSQPSSGRISHRTSKESSPRLLNDSLAQPAPPTLMYWSRAPSHGTRARIQSPWQTDGITAWLFGGCDENTCANDVFAFDIESFQWRPIPTKGDLPPPCRAHTATLVDNRRLVIIGGGQGGTYYDTIYVLDTLTRQWSRPVVEGSTTAGGKPIMPTPRRAHTAVLYMGRIWIFGGGDGEKALNDVWCLEVGYPETRSSAMTPWKWHGPLHCAGPTPNPRGYHTATLVDKVMLVSAFGDIWCLNLETLIWSMVNLQKSYRRLSHTATQVGSYLFIIGGHDSMDYRNDVLALNLVSLQYEGRQVLGRQPSTRGYHAALLADARIFMFGGYNGGSAFDDVWILDLAGSAYLPQVTSFVVDANS